MPFEWLVELFAGVGFIGICVLIYVRQKNHPRSAAGTAGRRSRFFGSVWWQAYYVEFTIFVVMLCIMLLRTLEARMVQLQLGVGYTDPEIFWHFPLSGWGAQWLWQGADKGTVEQLIYLSLIHISEPTRPY